MKKNFLLPHWMRIPGWIITVFCILMLIALFTVREFTDLIIGHQWMTLSVVPLFMLGLIFIAFSKEKVDDEFIMQIRGRSFIKAVWINCIFLLLGYAYSIASKYHIANLGVVNLVSTLGFYIIIFRYSMYKLRKSAGDEK